MPLPGTTALDKRLNAFRDDLADSRLQGQVAAQKFADGEAARVCAPFVDVVDKPSSTASLQTQFLCGHDVLVFDRCDGWAWVQGVDDGYVGYVRQEALKFASDSSLPETTHMVFAPRTFLYSQADLKLPRTGYRSMGSKVSVADHTRLRGTDYALLDTGETVIERHLTRIGAWATDPVSVAETLIHTPYLWGGNTGFGVDCSGLIALSNMLCGKIVLRDSDMQAASIGEEVDADFDRLERGDLVFWKGHVGMMTDKEHIIHANGHTMNVALEPLRDAVERIGYLYSSPTCVRRP